LKSHVGAVQVAVALLGGVHAFVQLPQCSGSLDRSTHEPLQAESPPVHDDPQLPALHTCDLLHGVPQPPQWS
jgi:hypothetical protein